MSDKNAEAMRRRWLDPEYRAKMRERLGAGQRRRYTKKSERKAASTIMSKIHKAWRKRDPEGYSAHQALGAKARKMPLAPCIICKGDVTHRQRKTCGSVCAAIAKGKGNALKNLGRKTTDETKKKISDASLKNWKNPEYRKLVSKRVSEGNAKEDVKFRRSQSVKMLWSDPEHAARHTKALMGNARYSRYEYLDRKGALHVFKSGEGWELSFARWLDEQELDWNYEPKTLLLSTSKRYVPDFWVQEWETYVELKAPHRDTDKAKQAKADGHPMIILQGRQTIHDFMVERSKA